MIDFFMILSRLCGFKLVFVSFGSFISDGLICYVFLSDVNSFYLFVFLTFIL